MSIGSFILNLFESSWNPADLYGGLSHDWVNWVLGLFCYFSIGDLLKLGCQELLCFLINYFVYLFLLFALPNTFILNEILCQSECTGLTVTLGDFCRESFSFWMEDESVTGLLPRIFLVLQFYSLSKSFSTEDESVTGLLPRIFLVFGGRRVC